MRKLKFNQQAGFYDEEITSADEYVTDNRIQITMDSETDTITTSAIQYLEYTYGSDIKINCAHNTSQLLYGHFVSLSEYKSRYDTERYTKPSSDHLAVASIVALVIALMYLGGR